MSNIIIEAKLAQNTSNKSHIIVRSNDLTFIKKEFSHSEHTNESFVNEIRRTVSELSKENKIDEKEISVVVDTLGIGVSVYDALKTKEYNVIAKKDMEVKSPAKGYYDSFTPYNIINFEQLEEYEKVREINEDYYEVLVKFIEMSQRIVSGDYYLEMNDKRDKFQLMTELTNQFLSKLREISRSVKSEESIWKSAPNINEEQIVANSLNVILYKNKYDQLMWAGIHTNKFMDRDGDILTDKAHRSFIKKVYDNEVPFPDLYIWHVPTVVGKATWLAYDERGFLLSGGVVDKEFEDIVISLCEKEPNMGMSHGMESQYIKYDEEGFMKEYVSFEITMLPNENAANLLTTFNVTE